MLSNYYQPAGQDAYNLTLMRRIDEQFAKRPFCGVPRMTASLITYPIFVERLWRSVKYEEVYLRDTQTVPSARIHLSDYFEFYNNELPHGVYFGTRAALTPASEAGV